MARFAKINEDNIVESVILVDNEHLIGERGEEVEALGVAYLNKVFGEESNWVQTSFNTRDGLHYGAESTEPDGGNALRKNHAAKGYTYDKTRNAFIPPKVYDSWVLNEDTCQWNAPTAMPEDGRYDWNEGTTSWDKLPDF